MTDERVVRAKQFAAEEHRRIMAASSSGISSTAASVLANLSIYSRIYVGSIRFDLSEADIRSVFGQFGTIRSISMVRDPQAPRHRGYGFIEYYAPEGAKLAQGLDETELAGRTIKVGRPNNFPTELPPGIPRPLSARLYLANLHPLVTDNDIMLLFEPYGKVSLAKVIREEEQHAAPNAAGYVEFEKVSDALNALNAMSTFELCGRRLRVCQTIIGGIIGDFGPDLLPASTAPNTIVGDSNTSILALKNIASYAELQVMTEAESDELQDEIQQECSKHGKVLRLILHGNEDTQMVTAFVQYEQPSSVQEAIPIYNNRWFDGRVLSAEPFSEDKFIMRDFS